MYGIRLHYICIYINLNKMNLEERINLTNTQG